MISHAARSLILAVSAAAVVAGSSFGGSTPEGRKKVLVELYTSQGCNSCPAAEKVFGKLSDLGVDSDSVVPIAFHVDYFDKPWKDRFSEHAHSERQWEYSLIYKRENGIEKSDYLFFTPMMMVDGRQPMLGSDQTKARAALRKATAERPGARVRIRFDSKTAKPRKKSLDVTVESLSSVLSGRDLLVGVAVWENPVETKVESGENAGKTLVEHYAVRKFTYRMLTLDRGKPKELSFPLELADGWEADHCGVAVFVQDVKNGRVYQADSLPWGTTRGSTAAR